MKRQTPSKTDSIDYKIDDTFEKNVCSSTEMTGLIPALPQDQEELRHYEELFRYLPAADDKEDHFQ